MSIGKFLGIQSLLQRSPRRSETFAERLTTTHLVILAAGAVDAGSYFGGQYFQNWKNALLGADWFTSALDGDIDPLISILQTQFTQAQNTTSPLILDLDGDGVETLGKTAGVQAWAWATPPLQQ